MRRAKAWLLGAGAAGLSFFVGAALGGLGVYLLREEHLLGEEPARQVAAFSDVTEPLAGELAERFRPWLKFDSEEDWRPLAVSRLLEERRDGAPAHRFCTRPATELTCAPVQDEADFLRQAGDAAALGASYIDLAGTELADYHGPDRCGDLADCGSGPGSAIYYHVTQSNDRYYIDYWWFLRYNHFARSVPSVSCRGAAAREEGVCGEHEGDWEGVTVVTPPGDDTQLDYVVFAAHNGTFRYAASELGLKDDRRPAVYIARGSHASYPQRCAANCDQPITFQGLLNLPEANFDGAEEWERNGEECEPNAPGSCLLALPRPDLDLGAWTVWSGRWGAGCPAVCRGEPGPTSPRSPGLQKRYQTPWCSTQRGVLTCDSRALSCSDWLGPLVAAAACDADVLAAGLRDPSLSPAGTLALTVRGEEKTTETTPGVVQALGDPLRPGDAVTVRGGGPATQLLVRAQQGRYLVEARFDVLELDENQTAVATIRRGAEGPTVSAAGRRPVEKRVLEIDLAASSP